MAPRTITKLKPYARYAESGSPWLGRVPQHWHVRKLRTLIEARNERNRPDLPLLSVAREKGVFVRPLKGEDNNHNVIPDDLSNYKVARAGDLVINKMKAWQGSMGIAPCDGVVSPAYFVFDLKIANHAFAERLLRSRPYVAHFGQVSDGVRIGQWDLSIQGMRQIPVAIPTDAEQAAIVRFLDYANRRLERTVRAKRNVIALLNEQKQTIIQRAVTRGFDVAAPLKYSGVPWVGHLPKHWKTPLLGCCLSGIEQGWSPLAAEGELAPNQWAVLTLSSVRRGILDPKAVKPVSRSAEIPKGIEVANGDFLLARSNTRDRVGDACIAEEVRPKTIFSDLIYRLKIREELLNPRFLLYQLLAPFGRGQIERDARGSSGTMPKITGGHIRSWRVILPPPEEQQSIVDEIDAGTFQLNKAIRCTQHEITLLHEYRIRLTADVATGRLDVREVAQHLPTEAEGPEPAVEPETPPDEECEEAAVVGATDA